MNWFKNLRIANKLMLSSGLIVMLSAVLGAVALISMEKMHAADDLVSGNAMPSVSAANQMVSTIDRYRRRELTFALTEGAVAREEVGKTLDERKSAVLQAMKKYEPLISEPEERTLYKQVGEDWAKYMTTAAKIRTLSQEDKLEELRNIVLTQGQKEVNAILSSMEGIVKVNENLANKAIDDAGKAYITARNIVVGVLAFSIIFSLWFAYVIAHMISRPLVRAVDIARTVAAGDLSKDIRAESTEETGQLISALKDMNESLVRIVGEVRQRSESIASASGEIATGNLDLSSRTEQQAGSLEETAASMEELTTTVRQNGDNARQANQLAVAASEVAMRGGAIVSEVVTTMSSINDSSKKIADITSVIDGIAFQTNILALNAAVEAARAGEQGRGFAVVAAEVRNLAQRSGAAAKDIKALIDDSVDRINSGTVLVDQAGATMAEIVSSVRHVTDIVAEITASSTEQTAGIEQINAAVTEMDNVTQQNAALVEEAAAASESLQEQAAALNNAVSVFKLDAGTAMSAGAGRSTRLAPATPAKRPASKPALRLARSTAEKPADKPVAAAKKALASTGSNDDWEEF